MPLALIPDVLLLLGSMLLPGAGVCLAANVGRGRAPVTFFALSLGLGFAAVSLLSLSLILIGSLAPTPLAVVWALVSLLTWGIAIARGRIGPYVRAWRWHVAADPLAVIAQVGTVVGVAVARWTVDPVANIAATVLRYWSDAVEIADAGRISDDTLQWNRLLEPVTNKIVLNSFNAAESLLLGRTPMRALSVLLFVVAIGLVVMAIALFGELGIRRLAPIGALLLFANQVVGSELTDDLGRNLAENWGRLVALSAVLAGIIAFRRPEPATKPHRAGMGPDAIAAGVLIGVTAGTHLVPASVAVAFVIAVALSWILVQRRLRPFAQRVAVMLGVAVVLGASVLLVPAGDLGLKGAAGGADYARITERLGLPPDFDPTRFIVTHSSEVAEHTPPIGAGDAVVAFGYRVLGLNVFDVRPGEELPLWTLLAPSVAAVVLVAAVMLRGPPRLRVASLAAAILAATILAVGIVFAIRYDQFALEAFGNRRLFGYAAIPFVLVGLAFAESCLWWLRARAHAPRLMVPVAALVTVAAVGTFMVPRASWNQAERRDRLEQQLEMLHWIGRNVPCEGRVLANRRTLGTFEAIAGRAGALEGMGPHVRPAVLEPAIRELFLARDFFLDPSTRATYLARRGIAAILVTKPPNRFGGYGGLPHVKPHRFDDVPFLRRVYENDSGVVYFVRGFKPNPSLPAVSGRPGFGC